MSEQVGGRESSKRPRARELHVRLGDLEPGPLNAITDVPGVGVGHTTLISGDGPLVVGSGPVRTGVTVIVPHEGDVWTQPVYAGAHRLNGNGEMTGLAWIAEAGLLTSPMAITNTHSVGVVRDALIAHQVAGRPPDQIPWALPVVAETWDGRLNDINGFHVGAEHVAQALAAVSRGAVDEGNVGGGTGMVAFGFKGGIGTSSRLVPIGRGGQVEAEYRVGVLVQANFGRRSRFTVAGVPVGRLIPAAEVPLPGPPSPPDAPAGAGSVIVVAATDAPLLPHQCARVAQRIGLGIGRLGGAGENSSGDLFLCFATGNRRVAASNYLASGAVVHEARALNDDYIDGLFHAVIEATEEAVLNALLAAETMVGRDGVTVHALPADRLVRLVAARGV
ncbi:MAG: P1 family peptidase [Chloroflexota bacterium]|nr:P1 family peptidase [Chloroflexota bacterium]